MYWYLKEKSLFSIHNTWLHGVPELAIHSARVCVHLNLVTRSKKFVKKGFRDGLSYSTPQRNKRKCHFLASVQFRDEWDRGWVMAFPLVSLFFEWWSTTDHP